MNLDDIRNTINAISGEKSQGSALTPEDFQLLLKQASLKHFKRKVGLPEEYRPGSPVPAQAFEETFKITVDLSPFKVYMGKYGSVPLYVNEHGYADTPSDFCYPSTMMYDSRDIDVVSDKEYNARKNDALTAPTYRNPVANIQNEYIRFAPLQNKFVEFVYLKFPEDPVFAYTQERGFVEYVPADSTELEWDEINQIDVMAILLFDMGINMEKQEVMAYADKHKQEGV